MIYVNPARAGMIPIRSPSLIWETGKPRASGDDPNTLGHPRVILQ